MCGSSVSDGKELTVIADGVTLITETSSSGTRVGTKVEISRSVSNYFIIAFALKNLTLVSNVTNYPLI